MKVVAPGKILVFGAYAVLEGGDALVAAVDRYAVADTERFAPSSAREVRAAIGDDPAPAVDTSALYENGTKLGLGSSAAALVATLGVRARARGENLADPAVRATLFAAARRAHAEAQGGGSGVDVAASTFGGALFYRMDPAADPASFAAELPEGLALEVFWSGQSARTSDLLERVRAFARTDRRHYDRLIERLAEASSVGRSACLDGDIGVFVRAGTQTAAALAQLGRQADAPIVPLPFADLALLAEQEGGAFYPSGAGGGDVGVWLGRAPASPGFVDRARAVGMSRLEIGLDRAGVRTRED